MLEMFLRLIVHYPEDFVCNILGSPLCNIRHDIIIYKICQISTIHNFKKVNNSSFLPYIAYFYLISSYNLNPKVVNTFSIENSFI